MAELRIDPAELRGLVKEPEAAELLGLHPWQLRDVRLAKKIGPSRIVGKKARYTLHDLTEYLPQGHERGTERQ